jgi:undecaprenyl-diphosphatase
LDTALLIKALILGIVEGITEFLPISSTGHLIIAEQLLHFDDEKGKVFEIVIQFPAILAVCWEYRERLLRTAAGLVREVGAQRFVLHLFIAFLPAAVLGLLFHSRITATLFHPVPVAIAFIVGGVAILWIERRKHTIRIDNVDAMGWKDALKIGFAQALSLIPGTSRSGATIMGGLFFGLSRQAATEFSFFLAIPTMFAATGYELFKNRDLLSSADLPVFAVGGVASFVCALIAVKGLLRFISSHDFSAFAWYRIVFGALVLSAAYFGVLNWSQG